jgi:hypothetical protein
MLPITPILKPLSGPLLAVLVLFKADHHNISFKIGALNQASVN